MKSTKLVRPIAPGAVWRSGSLLAISLIAATSTFAQATAPSKAPSPTSTEEEEAITLSPFTVDATKDKGYYAENTLAGSRMKTNVADLGASISVITKQQLEDTASIDINDVFRYEINTEGSSTYTPPVISPRSDGAADTIAGFTAGGTGTPQTNSTANRVRGLGSPSPAINFYPAISQVPMDSYNIQSLEISRGPNSMLFGMGSPAGIVNSSYAQAALNRDRTTVYLRVDDRGSRRGSLSLNRVLMRDKLAIYVAGLYNNTQFERKPSYDITRRQYGSLTFKPFSKTTIRAFVEGYNNSNRRPNSVTPRDFVTEWNMAGRPIYDALTKKVTYLNTGKESGPFIAESANPLRTQVVAAVEAQPNFNPALWNATKTTYNGVSVYGDAAYNNTGSIFYVPGMFYVNQPRTVMQIADGQLVNWFQPLGLQRYRTQFGTATNPAANADLFPTTANIYASNTFSDIYNRYYTSVGGWSAVFNRPNVGSFKYPGVYDKSIYDYSKINILQMNFGKDRNTNYNVELEQEILPSLHLSAGWFRQDFDSVTNYTVAQLNATTLYIDTNKYLPDGTPNPYVGHPYVEDQDPDRFLNSERDNHYRAMLAWTPDFTQNKGWTKWLGRHQLLGLWSYQDTLRTFIRQRLHYTDSTSLIGKTRYLNNPNNNADGTPTGWSYRSTSLRRTYYLADPGDPMGVVTTSSGTWDYNRYTGNIKVYDYANSKFDTVGMQTEFLDRDEGTARSARQIESLSAAMTNYLWNDRIITTFGVREDDYRARNTNVGILRDAAGNQVAPAMTNQERWINGIYQTETIFNRWTPVWDELKGTTKTLGGVVKPFRNWSSIDRRANDGNIFWQFIRDFGISYNKSDNFNAPDVAQVDVFGNRLPKPTGEGKDYGFQFTILDNKLFARVTWFEASNENERLNPGTSISRLTGNVDTTLFRNWARTIALINMGFDPRLDSFGTNLSQTEEDQVQTAAEKIWGQDYDYYANVGSISATRDARAEGVELLINYNPTRNWTLKLTAGKQDTYNSNVLKQYDAWYNQRAPIWEAATASKWLLPQYQTYANEYIRNSGREVFLGTFWNSYGYTSEIQKNAADGNVNALAYYNNVVFPQYALARDLNGQRVMGQRRYRASLLTNYAFDRSFLKGFAVGGSERWEDKGIVGYYGKASGVDRAFPNRMDLSDTTKPIWSKANFYTDFWVSYNRKVWNGKYNMKLQLNVVDVFQSGGLRVTAVNYDGTPYTFRIVDPRQFIFSATLDF